METIKEGVIMVSYQPGKSDDTSVLVVGVKGSNGYAVEIINAYSGTEARELWEKLTIPKEKKN